MTLFRRFTRCAVGRDCQAPPAGLRSRFPAHRGLTTGELMISFSIIGIFTTAVSAVLLGALGSWDKGASKSISDTTASLALQQAVRVVMYGKSATASNKTLTVVMTDGSSVQLYASNGTLYERPGSTGGATALSTGIADFTPTLQLNDGTDRTVTLTLTGDARTGENDMQTQFSQVVALRNYDVIAGG
jgi:hypothetical protein